MLSVWTSLRIVCWGRELIKKNSCYFFSSQGLHWNESDGHQLEVLTINFRKYRDLKQTN